MPALDAAAVEEDVDLVAVGEDSGEQRIYGGLGGQVCGVDRCAAAESFDERFRLGVGGVSLRRPVS